MKKNTISCVLAILLNLFFTVPTNARTPVWTFTPLTATTITLPKNQTATVQYTITNQAPKTLLLAMQAKKAIRQLTSGPSVCPNPFMLAPLQSCVLSIEILGNLLTQPIVGGPSVCISGAGGTPNPNACYQPSGNNQLRITPLHAVTISASLASLALSVNCLHSSTNCTYSNAALTGKPRLITVTNHSALETAYQVSASAVNLPEGTSITPTFCTISPLGTCVFTITPGEIPSVSPNSINLNISGLNTNSVSTSLYILTYGSVYQSGYVFSIDDSTPDTTSAGGTVAALANQSDDIPWQENCVDVSTCTATNANHYFAGLDNTNTIVNTFTEASIPLNSYAAALCRGFTSDGFTDWYLPAICQMGYGDGTDPSYPCGASANPAIQNMQSNLADLGLANLDDFCWSSTQITAPSLTLTHAYYHLFDLNGGTQGGEVKNEYRCARCVRDIN